MDDKAVEDAAGAPERYAARRKAMDFGCNSRQCHQITGAYCSIIRYELLRAIYLFPVAHDLGDADRSFTGNEEQVRTVVCVGVLDDFKAPVSIMRPSVRAEK